MMFKYVSFQISIMSNNISSLKSLEPSDHICLMAHSSTFQMIKDVGVVSVEDVVGIEVVYIGQFS